MCTLQIVSKCFRWILFEGSIERNRANIYNKNEGSTLYLLLTMGNLILRQSRRGDSGDDISRRCGRHGARSADCGDVSVQNSVKSDIQFLVDCMILQHNCKRSFA